MLGGRAQARAKSSDGPVHSAGMYKLAKDSAVTARTPINQLKAVLVIADPTLRERLSNLGNAELFRTCARLGPRDGGGDEDVVAPATFMALRMLAERIEQLTGQIDELNKRLPRLVEGHAPQLLAPVGIGVDTAAEILVVTGDNPERIKSEAALAKLAGIAPVPTGSGMTSGRHRINHGGHRQLNAAIYRTVIVRMRLHQPTTNYVNRRTAEGKTKREIIRCLKRYVIREVYHLIRPAPRTTAAAS